MRLAALCIAALFALGACGVDPVDASDADGAVDGAGGGADGSDTYTGPVPEGPGCEDGVKYPPVRPFDSGTPRAVDGRYVSFGLHAVPVADDFEAALCARMCEVAPRCGDDDLGGAEGCAAFCEGLVASGRAANAACYLADCRERERCLGAAAIEPLAPCPTLCGAIEGCPGLAALGLPPREGPCLATCAGLARAVPDFADSLVCLGGRAAACDVDGAFACLDDGTTFCGALCAEVGGCDAGAPFASVYASGEACFAECAALGPVEAFRALGCFGRHGCETTRACVDGPPSFCEAYYDEAARVCLADSSWPPAFDLLVAACETDASEGPLERVGPCLTGWGCGGLEGAFCLDEPPAPVEPDPRCAWTCDVFCACGVFEADACRRDCERSATTEEIDALAACLEEATCETVEACLPDGPPVDGL